MSDKNFKYEIPDIKLTANDFISTFPWGLRSDEVRIKQQETENALLDAETTAAMAVMLGSDSFSDRLDYAWKTMLNSQNHDIHVCTQEEAGIAWCDEARPLAEGIRDDAAAFIAGKLGSDIEINTLSIPVKDVNGNYVPSFGYVSKQQSISENTELVPWDKAENFGDFSAAVQTDGRIQVRVGRMLGNVGGLSVTIDNELYNVATNPPTVKNAKYSPDNNKAYLTVEGALGKNDEIKYVHNITVSKDGIDYDTEFDYGDGVNFGPDIKDFESEPRRTHYFQHEKKLCMTFALESEKPEVIYNSPFLTWKAQDDVRSIESLQYLALQGERGGIAHFNIGQSAYAVCDGSAKHVLCFSPRDYIYGPKDKITANGKHTHHYRFVPYRGDFRSAELTYKTDIFNRAAFSSDCIESVKNDISASLIRIKSNSVKSTALFEREGKIYLRIAEWAGQEDDISIIYGDESAKVTEVTHALKPIKEIGKNFRMRPWEIKTLLIEGRAVPITEEETAARRTFCGLPSGWELRSQFECPSVKTQERNKSGILYFATGYHDGFVRPMERHSKTMAIEIERTKRYDGYSQYWELGGSCFERMHVNEPEYLEGLKKELKDNNLEIVGGTWCEPFALIISGESNIRQMFYGMKTIKETLDYDVKIYANQEHGTYAQMPQILRSFGLNAVINRTQWAPYGYESAVDADVANWIGPDGSAIFMIPRYRSQDYNNCPWDDRNLQNGSVTGHNRVWRTREKFEQMLREALDHGIKNPLMTMLEDIWADFLRTTDEEIEFYDSLPFVQFISLTKYLEMYGVTEDK